MKISPIIVALSCLGVTALAQSRAPHLAYVYPAGGQAGTTFQVVVGGQNLMAVSNAFITGPGVRAVVLDHQRPMNQKEFNDLRDRLKVLQEKFQAARRNRSGANAWTAADAAEREQIRAKILRNPPNRKANPAMMDTVTLKVAMAADVAPGDREIRLAMPSGLSNPLRFCISNLREFSKPAAQAANPELEKFIEKLGGKPAPTGTPKYEAAITLPAVVNGQITPGEVDRYRFAARRGQQLIFTASARSLIPYLADAVPGWFEAVLTIYDAKGMELAHQERFRFDPDPVLHFEVPRDGEYVIAIHDSIYRGREDFVYRLTAGELPLVTGIFPLGGRRGEKTSVTLTGWNLKAKSLVHENTQTGTAPLTGDFLNPVPFTVDDLPECTESATNDSLQTAAALTLPIIVNGCVRRPGEQKYFKFAGQAGQKIVAEVFARRLGSPLDSNLRLTDASGKQIAFNDDWDDPACGLETHHADSYFAATLPAAGTYFIALADTQGHGGPDFAYRLRLGGPEPDFALRVVPSSLSLRAGMSAPVTVYALRRDGCTNAISLSLQDAPPGFSLSGARIDANQDKAQFTLKAPAWPTDEPVAITITGSAVIQGKQIVHVAEPAEDMMQAFIYRHLVPVQEFAVTVSGPPRRFLAGAFKILSQTPVKLSPGRTARVRVSAPPGNFSGRFKLELRDAPAGISLARVAPVAAGREWELTFAADQGKARPGFKGNLICEVVPQFQKSSERKKAAAQPTRRDAAAMLPAIPFWVAAE